MRAGPVVERVVTRGASDDGAAPTFSAQAAFSWPGGRAGERGVRARIRARVVAIPLETQPSVVAVTDRAFAGSRVRIAVGNRGSRKQETRARHVNEKPAISKGTARSGVVYKVFTSICYLTVELP